MIKSKKAFAIVVTFLLLFTSYFLMFMNFRQIKMESGWVQHSQVVTNKIGSLRVQKQLIDKSVYQSLSQNNDKPKLKFLTAIDSTNVLFKELREMVKDNLGMVKIIDKDLTPALSKDLKIAKSVFNHIGTDKTALETKAEYIRSYDSTLDKNEVVKALNSLLNNENGILEMRQKKLRMSTESINFIILISLCAALYFTLLAGLQFWRGYKERKKLTLESLAYKTKLESQVEELEKANGEINILKNQEKFSSTGRMARTIAHEIRNPLTNINLASEQIKDLLPENEEAEMLCNMVDRNSTRINELISSLLNATRFMEIKNEDVDVNKLINEALDLANDRIKLLNVKIVKDFDKALCSIKGDEEKLRIAMLNIIVNAIEAMPAKNPILKIATIQDVKGKCKIYVTDNGKGMSKEVLQKLFDPFFTSKEKGTGLGLTNTQNIIITHKGEINVKSKENEGTEFEIIL